MSPELPSVTSVMPPATWGGPGAGGDLLRVRQGQGPQDAVSPALESASRQPGHTDLPSLASPHILDRKERQRARLLFFPFKHGILLENCVMWTTR